MKTFSVKTVVVVLALGMFFSVSLSAEPIDYEGIVDQFIRAFQEGQSFSGVQHFFFQPDELDDFIQMIKNDASGKIPKKIRDSVLKNIDGPDQRDKVVRQIRNELEKSKRVWQKLLKYPADQGTQIQIRKIQITIKFNPLKQYRIRVFGKYSFKGSRTRFSLRADFLMLNGKLRIVKFRG